MSRDEAALARVERLRQLGVTDRAARTIVAFETYDDTPPAPDRRRTARAAWGTWITLALILAAAVAAVGAAAFANGHATTPVPHLSCRVVAGQRQCRPTP